MTYHDEVDGAGDAVGLILLAVFSVVVVLGIAIWIAVG